MKIRIRKRTSAGKPALPEQTLMPTDLSFRSAPSRPRGAKARAKFLLDTKRMRGVSARAWGRITPKGRIKPNQKLGGTYLQILMRLIRFPEGQTIIRDPNGKIVGTIHTSTGRINSIDDVSRTYRKVSGNMKGTRPEPGHNAIFCYSVSSDPRRRSEIKQAGVVLRAKHGAPKIKHMGVGLAGHAVLKSYVMGYDYIFAYSAPRTYMDFKAKEPTLTVRQHFDRKQDGILHDFHAKQRKYKPAGTVVALFENARPEDKQAGGACALVHYKIEDIEKWIVEEQESIQPWLDQYGITVRDGKVVRPKARRG